MNTPFWITCIVYFFAGWGLSDWIRKHTKFSEDVILGIGISTFICFWIISVNS